MQQFRLIDQLTTRANRVTDLERQVKALTKQVEKFSHLREAALTRYIRGILDTAPFVNRGVVEWDEDDGRTPERMDEALDDAMRYLDPRFDDDEAVAPPPEAFSTKMLRIRCTSAARKVAESSRADDADFRKVLGAAKQAITEYEQARTREVNAAKRQRRAEQKAA